MYLDWLALKMWVSSRLPPGITTKTPCFKAQIKTQGAFGFSNSYMTAFSVVGLVCGIVVVISALMLKARPTEHSAWGSLILVFSAISLISMGGWFVGALLGIIGGAFALS